MAKLLYISTEKFIDMIKKQLKKDKLDVPIYKEGELSEDLKQPYLIYKEEKIILDKFLPLEGCLEAKFNVTFYGEYDKTGPPRQGLDCAVRALRNDHESFKIKGFRVLLRACLWIREDSLNMKFPDEQVTIIDFIFGVYPEPDTGLIESEEANERDKRLVDEVKSKKDFEKKDKNKKESKEVN